MTTHKGEYERLVDSYLDRDLSERAARREAILDLYGDEIRAEWKRQRVKALQDCDDWECDAEDDTEDAP